MKNSDMHITGLTMDQVIDRKNKGLVNTDTTAAGKSVKEIIRSNTLTYFNFIFIIITVLLCAVGSFRNLTFLPIIKG